MEQTANEDQKGEINEPSKATGPVKIQTFQSGATVQNQIYERIKIVNTSSSTIALSTVKIRYYFTYQGSTSYNFACDYSPIGSGNVQSVFVAMSPIYTDAEAYQEISFASAAGNLAAGASVEIQARIWKSDWSTIDSTKNYSYNPSTSYVDWEKVTAYVNGTLSWGIEPGSSSSSSSVLSSVSSTGSIASSSSRSSVSSSISSARSSSVSSTLSSTSSTTSVQYQNISLPFSFDGAGDKYWQTSGTINYINSWNLDILDINGVNIKNQYISSGSLPPTQNGYYYIHYKGLYSYSHVEINGTSVTSSVSSRASSISSTVSSSSLVSSSRSSSISSRASSLISSAISSASSSVSSSRSAVSSYASSDYPIWNSQVVYNTIGMIVQYNQNLYMCQGFSCGLNPELNNGQYYPWLWVAPYPGGPMGEGPFIGSGNYDKYVLGEYTVYNNVWGTTETNTQTLTAYSYSYWYVVSTQPDTSGVKSYPNTGLVNLNKTIGSIGTLTSSFEVIVPSTGNWEVAYDIWVPSEVMIWMYTSGNVSPIAAGWDSSGAPIPSATNINISGYTWNVYRGGNNVVSFVAVTSTDGSWKPAKVTKGTVDIKAILNWIVAQGWISSSGTVGAVQFGFEISGTGGVPLKFICTNFSITK